MPKRDDVHHPAHYTAQVPGIECIQVTQHFNFNRGNAIKYLWRCGSKGNDIQDLEKAKQYINFEIARLRSLRSEQSEVPGLSQADLQKAMHDGEYPR